MYIRKTREHELEEILGIYARARQFMAETGNPNQWGTAHPPVEAVRQDIADGVSYVCVQEADDAAGEAERIEAVFMYAVHDDPTYAVIEGAWPNDRPYGVMHRVASRGRVKGSASFAMQWCFSQCGNLRCDTHEDNRVMQHVLEKNGFERCGIITLANGEPRIAYQKTK